MIATTHESVCATTLLLKSKKRELKTFQSMLKKAKIALAEAENESAKPRLQHSVNTLQEMVGELETKVTKLTNAKQKADARR